MRVGLLRWKALGVAFWGLLIGATVPGQAFLQAAGPVQDKVKPVVPLKALAFDLEDVRLLSGPFLHAMELDQKYLLALDVDRLLHTFRVNAGLPSSARPLGGWEAPRVELRGHFTGHYLSACACMYASTGDERFKLKGAQVVTGLAECQRKLGSGYLSAFPEEFIVRVEQQKRVWAPWYTLHKILAGLLDMNEHCDNAEALDVARKFAVWVKTRADRLSDAQMQAMLRNEHGGMNEALANLYARTGDDRYLKLAERFNHMAVLDPASQRRDTLTGLHANTQIPKFIGTAREYELTGSEWFQTASRFFWNTVVNERSYVIGGHSNGEMFSPKEKLSLALGPNTTETCNTYNMLKLTRHLFAWDPRIEYADYYERALINHILASQNPETGMMCYYLPLRSGSRKVYNNFDNSFWCCTGTGVENHAKYGDSIYFRDADKTLYVNLFIASELTWKARGLKLRQETRFPEEQTTRLVITTEQPIDLTLKLRHPSWAESGYAIKVNGEPLAVENKPGSFAEVNRSWKTGDTVEIALPFRLHTEGFHDNPSRLALLHGPLVLCGTIDAGKPVPAIVTEPSQLLAALKPVPDRYSTFAGSPEIFRLPGETASASVTLEPLYKVHGNRHYVVYWDLFTRAQWQAKETDYAAELVRRKELESRTVDLVNPGEEQNERDHKLETEKSEAGVFGNRGWRHADDGGWFRYVVKVLPDRPQELSVTYWGSDAGRRVFDILVDGKKLATETLENRRPDRFYDQTYALSDDFTRGKNHITVTFQAHPSQTAGGIFGLRSPTHKVIRTGKPQGGSGWLGCPHPIRHLGPCRAPTSGGRLAVGFRCLYAKQTLFRVVEAATLEGWRCGKLAQRQARPNEDAKGQDGEKNGWEPTQNSVAIRFLLQMVASHGFNHPPAIEPNRGTRPRFQHLEKGRATFWKEHGEPQERSRKGTALALACPCGRHSSKASTLLRATCLSLDSSPAPRAEIGSATPRQVASSSSVSPQSRSRSTSRPRSSSSPVTMRTMFPRCSLRPRQESFRTPGPREMICSYQTSNRRIRSRASSERSIGSPPPRIANDVALGRRSEGKLSFSTLTFKPIPMTTP